MTDFKVVMPTTTEEWQRDMNMAYNQALDDVWKKAISKYDECLDLGELREIVEELKR